MADIKNAEKKVDDDADERRNRRRNRLQALRQAPAPATKAGPAAGAAAGGGANVALQRKVIGRAYRVLTGTPADESGMVEGTPFTQAGVARLMEALKTRASAEGTAGARAAGRMVQFLSGEDEEGERVHGASVERLQRIQRLAGNFGMGGPARA